MNCQPFDLIALGATELKQKKAAGVVFDDLHQLEYSGSNSLRDDSHGQDHLQLRSQIQLDSTQNARMENSKTRSGIQHRQCNVAPAPRNIERLDSFGFISLA